MLARKSRALLSEQDFFHSFLRSLDSFLHANRRSAPRVTLLALAIVVLTIKPVTFAKKGAPPEVWVGTWSASMQGPIDFEGRVSPTGGFENQTLRMIVRTTIGGSRVRVHLSNAFGTDGLVVGATHIAIRTDGSAIVPGSDRALTFSGRSAITIPPGAEMISDPMDLAVPELGYLAISIYLPNKTGVPTWHSTGLHTTFISGMGDFTAKLQMPDWQTQTSWYWLAGVDVTAPQGTGAIVALGASITDGARSTVDADQGWPSELAWRLLRGDLDREPKLSVLNAGISGNRILHNQIATNALARLDRDVLVQPGVQEMIILEGTNDIGFSRTAGGADQAVSAQDIIAGMRQIVERAHTRGIKIIAGTLPPFEGANYFSPEGENKREVINAWIRNGGSFDGVIDFETVIRDPQHPTRILPSYDSGDHLHPNDAGYKAMADAIDLSLFSQAVGQKKEKNGKSRKEK
jgi:lysophospholipase L1-like esterase